MKTSKILIAAGAVILGVIIGVVYMNFMEADYINEDEVRAIVTDRYQGDISNISLSDNDDYFQVTVDDEQYLYEITINRSEGTVKDIKSSENPDYVEETEVESEGDNTEEADSAEGSSEEGSAAEEEQTSNDTESNGSDIISVEEAREIAMNEVGGLFLHSTLNEEVSPSEYLIANLIDGDDEGAIVSINALNGTINKVIFLDIDFEEIGDLESFMRQVASYNAQSQHYYIEYDDDDWDDDDWDDDD